MALKWVNCVVGNTLINLDTVSHIYIQYEGKGDCIKAVINEKVFTIYYSEKIELVESAYLNLMDKLKSWDIQATKK